MARLLQVCFNRGVAAILAVWPGLLAALSMGGIPLFFGFIAKEEIYAAPAVDGAWPVLLLLVAIAGNLLALRELIKLEMPDRDLGVLFLDGQYIGSYARVGAHGAWNTTTDSGGRYAKVEPTKEVVALAQRAQDLFGLTLTSVDVVETPSGPLVFEVSAFGGFRGLTASEGVDAARLYVDHVLQTLEQRRRLQ